MALQMHIIEFEYQIEHIIANNIAKAYPYNWDENHLTFGIVSDFHRYFQHVELTGTRTEVEIDWEIYKFKGPRENRFGDIGILISTRLRDGTIINGAGFMEAKLRDRRNNRFAEISALQCRRILKHAPQAMMLLYDYDRVSVSDPVRGYNQWPWNYHNHNHRFTITNSPVVPLQLVVGTARKDTSLYEFASSPSFQLAHRYLNSLDLEFSPQAIDAVRGVSTSINQPNYIMRLRIARNGQELPEGLDINRDSFGTIDEAS